MNATAKVFVVDDDAGVLRGLARLLRSAGFDVETFVSAAAFLEAMPAASAGCAVVDVAMPDTDGFALYEALVARQSPLAVVFLTGHGNIAMGVRAIKAGAADFLTKPVDEPALLDAVRSAIDRSHAAVVRHAELARLRARFAALTPRERDVFALVVAGHLNKAAGAALGTAEKTIKVHRARVMAKMQARTLAELIGFAHRLGVAGDAHAP